MLYCGTASMPAQWCILTSPKKIKNLTQKKNPQNMRFDLVQLILFSSATCQRLARLCVISEDDDWFYHRAAVPGSVTVFLPEALRWCQYDEHRSPHRLEQLAHQRIGTRTHKNRVTVNVFVNIGGGLSIRWMRNQMVSHVCWTSRCVAHLITICRGQTVSIYGCCWPFFVHVLWSAVSKSNFLI